ncbi:MAG TPA: DUF1178 family protein [Methyloceanibacter sp.]|nr:DUF1178 family protein [Methyloceanibacter sp.]
MIRYALACEEGHGFEAWFDSAASYDEQAVANAITCPSCGSAQVRKAPMAPYVAKRRAETSTPARVDRPQPYAMLRKLRAEFTANSDYVGPKFPEEARKIHFDEAPARTIHGEATLKEAQELNAEGIPICPLPPLPEDQN